MSHEFNAYFTKLVTGSLYRTAANEAHTATGARVGGRLRAGLAERRSDDRRRILVLLENEPDSIRPYLAARNRARNARRLLAILVAACLAAAASLAVALWRHGSHGTWVAYSDSTMVALAIGACFAYVVLVSAQASTARRVEQVERRSTSERRLAGDRRRPGQPEPPAGSERRSGVDRRTLAARGWSGVT